MASLNASGIPVTRKQNATFRNLGEIVTATSGLIPNQETLSVRSVPLWARTSEELGTQPDEQIQQYSTVDQSSAQKVSESLTDSLVSRTADTYVPTSGDQPEIALKPVSQHGTRHTGNRLQIINSEEDQLISRNKNDSERPAS